MSEANKQLALEFLDAMSAGDPERFAACLTEDAITKTRGFGQVCGERDRATMVATVAAFREMVPTGFRPEILSLFAEGDKVLLEFEGHGVLRNGTPYPNHYAFIFTFRDGKISQLNEYFCTVQADNVILPLLAAESGEMAHGTGDKAD